MGPGTAGKNFGELMIPVGTGVRDDPLEEIYAIHGENSNF